MRLGAKGCDRPTGIYCEYSCSVAQGFCCDTSLVVIVNKIRAMERDALTHTLVIVTSQLQSSERKKLIALETQ